MHRIAIIGTGLLCLLFLVGVTIADPQEASDNNAPVAETESAPAADLAPEEAIEAEDTLGFDEYLEQYFA